MKFRKPAGGSFRIQEQTGERVRKVKKFRGVHGRMFRFRFAPRMRIPETDAPREIEIFRAGRVPGHKPGLDHVLKNFRGQAFSFSAGLSDLQNLSRDTVSRFAGTS